MGFISLYINEHIYQKLKGFDIQVSALENLLENLVSCRSSSNPHSTLKTEKSDATRFGKKNAV